MRMSGARKSRDLEDFGLSGDLADTRQHPSRAVVTLSPAAATAARRLGAAMGDVSIPEVVRRGLMVLDLTLNLPDDEEIVIRHKDSNELERIRFSWETF